MDTRTSEAPRSHDGRQPQLLMTGGGNGAARPAIDGGGSESLPDMPRPAPVIAAPSRSPLAFFKGLATAPSSSPGNVPASAHLPLTSHLEVRSQPPSSASSQYGDGLDPLPRSPANSESLRPLDTVSRSSSVLSSWRIFGGGEKSANQSTSGATTGKRGTARRAQRQHGTSSEKKLSDALWQLEEERTYLQEELQVRSEVASQLAQRMVLLHQKLHLFEENLAAQTEEAELLRNELILNKLKSQENAADHLGGGWRPSAGGEGVAYPTDHAPSRSPTPASRCADESRAPRTVSPSPGTHTASRTWDPSAQGEVATALATERDSLSAENHQLKEQLRSITENVDQWKANVKVALKNSKRREEDLRSAHVALKTELAGLSDTLNETSFKAQSAALKNARLRVHRDVQTDWSTLTAISGGGDDSFDHPNSSTMFYARELITSRGARNGATRHRFRRNPSMGFAGRSASADSTTVAGYALGSPFGTPSMFASQVHAQESKAASFPYPPPFLYAPSLPVPLHSASCVGQPHGGLGAVEAAGRYRENAEREATGDVLSSCRSGEGSGMLGHDELHAEVTSESTDAVRETEHALAEGQVHANDRARSKPFIAAVHYSNVEGWSVDTKLRVAPGMTAADLIEQCCSQFQSRYQVILVPEHLCVRMTHHKVQRTVVLSRVRELHSFTYLQRCEAEGIPIAFSLSQRDDLAELVQDVMSGSCPSPLTHGPSTHFTNLSLCFPEAASEDFS